MDDDIEATKRFLDNAWKSFKLELVNDYKIKKEETSEDYYEKVNEFCNSKLFKGFGILQLIVFLHFNRNNKKTRHKDAFVLLALRGLYTAINKIVNKVFYGVNKIDKVEKFNIDFILDNILMEKNDNQIKEMTMHIWNDWRDNLCKHQLWSLMDKMLEILKDVKVKGF